MTELMACYIIKDSVPVLSDLSLSLGSLRGEASLLYCEQSGGAAYVDGRCGVWSEAQMT